MGQYKTNRILKNWGPKNGEKWDNMVLYGFIWFKTGKNIGIMME